MTRHRQRAVWGLGLLAYLAGLFFFMLVPVVHPFTGAVVLLACTSSSGAAVKDDMAVMGVIVTELVIWCVLMASMAAGVRAWLQPILPVTFAIGVLLPIGTIIYRLARPWPKESTAAAGDTRGGQAG
jgi:hypothetical protein